MNHAAFTSALLQAAARGDPTAARIAHEHGQSLGEFATAATVRVGTEGPGLTLVLARGAFRNPSLVMADAISARVRVAYPQVMLVEARFEPVVGALRPALEALGGSFEDETVACLTATLPSELLVRNLLSRC